MSYMKNHLLDLEKTSEAALATVVEDLMDWDDGPDAPKRREIREIALAFVHCPTAYEALVQYVATEREIRGLEIEPKEERCCICKEVMLSVCSCTREETR